jgi:hypothetical protein
MGAGQPPGYHSPVINQCQAYAQAGAIVEVVERVITGCPFSTTNSSWSATRPSKGKKLNRNTTPVLYSKHFKKQRKKLLLPQSSSNRTAVGTRIPAFQQIRTCGMRYIEMKLQLANMQI